MKEGKTILSAGMIDDSPIGIIHTVTGTEKHTFSFDDTGAYTARVIINGLRMVLVTSGHADFPVTVTPEFQPTIPVMALVIGSAIVFMRSDLRRLRVSFASSVEMTAVDGSEEYKNRKKTDWMSDSCYLGCLVRLCLVPECSKDYA